MSTGKEARFVVAPERMPEIPVAKMTEAQKQAAAEISAGPRGEVKGPFVAFLRSPELLRRVQKVGEYLRFMCPIDKRLGEFAAIIGAPAWSQRCEWWAHYRPAGAAGLERGEPGPAAAGAAAGGEGAKERSPS